MSDSTLYVDFTTRKFTSEEGGAAETQRFVVGDVISIGLVIRESVDGEPKLKPVNIRTLMAAVGKVSAPPTLGKFALTINTIDVDDISLTTSALGFQTLLTDAGLTNIDSVELLGVGNWLVRTTETDEDALDISIKENLLYPESFVRIWTYERDGNAWFEVQLLQTPLAFTEVFDSILPDPPFIEEVRDGAPRVPGTQANSNEVQAIVVPEAFTGTYYIKFDFHSSTTLGTADGPEEIAAALNAMYTDGIIRFKVTNPEAQKAYVEFVGPLKETDHDPMEIVVNSFQVGIPTFTLDFGKDQMRAFMKGQTLVKDIPFEVQLEIVDDAADLDEPTVKGRFITFQMNCVLSQEQITEEIGEVPGIDWLRPGYPKNYIPFTPDQVITGQQHYTATFGTAATLVYTFDHGLATDNIANIGIRENTIDGVWLENGVDFTAVINNEDTVTITMAAQPLVNGLVVIITSAGPKSAFQAHTHTIGQIVGLQDALDALDLRLAEIENLLPTVVPSSTVAPGVQAEIAVPDKGDVYPGRFFPPNAHLGDLSKLRPGGLLPATHDATAEAVTDILVSGALPDTNDTFIDRVFINDDPTAIPIPGGSGRKPSTLEFGEHLASDGRVWYKVVKDGATNSFYPFDFERTLWTLFANDKQFRAGGEFTFEFDLELRMANSKTAGQYSVVIEVGSATQQASPSPVGVNLQDIVWDATPVLNQRVILTDVKQKHHFGFAFRRSADGSTIAGDQLLYDAWEAAGAVPSSANFAVRARLIRFDTENSITKAKGLVFYMMTNAKGGITNS